MIVPPHQIDASIILTTFSSESLVDIPLPRLRTEERGKTPVFAVGKVRFKHCTDCLGGEICRRYSFAPKTTLEQVGKLQVLCLSPLLRSHFDAAPATKRIVMDGRKWEIKNGVSRQHVLWRDIENRKMSMWRNNISLFVFVH